MNNVGPVSWRAMSAADLPAVSELADAIHVDYPEEAEVFAEKFTLYPAGCFIFDHAGTALGYFISHPWLRKNPPPLNRKLGALPAQPDIFYLHDLALAPAARGHGAAGHIIREAEKLAVKAHYHRMALVAVGDADTFWLRQGFEPEMDEEMQRKLANYGESAIYMEKALA
ncbi:N-acetyltransferase [Altericroceibacterium spongiae]|uniref:N-acetyltransferase n=1 Tax=Altericroceibacterium spongiae TaxID=2320269 RepID=A0A420EFA7_9SPHN|nr:GNAT family N-acetyltransferase [Altericroceibacterium spongiae]RKF19385.1 N-acetyltransferase [Altericroceibacterium spongiae]